MLVMSVLISVGALLLNNHLYNNSLITTTAYSIIIISLLLFIFLLLLFLIKYKGKYHRYRKIIKTVEDNLISIKAYKKKKGKAYYDIPKIRIKPKKYMNGLAEKEIGNYIEIDMLNDLTIREAIEKKLEIWDTALPKGYVCANLPFFSKDGKKLIVEYQNINQYKQEKYNMTEFIEIVNKLSLSSLYYDKNHVIDLNEFPHWIFAGSTGSGKTTLNEMIITECIIKGFDIRLGDVHSSLNLYSDYLKYYTTASDILNMLKTVETEMRIRLNEIGAVKERAMTSLKLGKKPIVIFIEEYIDTKRLLTKDELKEFDNLITKISISARKTGIYLFIAAQAISTSIMSTDDKQQFSKIYLGNGDRNEYVKTFGEGIDVPIRSFERKGEGYICINNKISIIRCPYLVDLGPESLNKIL